METSNERKRLVVGISGATGSILGIRTLEALREAGAETHLVLTSAAERTIRLETEYSVEEVRRLATFVYDENDIGASIASGSFLHDGMIVVPCSIKSLSAIANSYNDNLLVRAADVTLKERRRLVLVVRETPLHAGHLRLMLQVTEQGGVVLPPVPAFYHSPKTMEEVIAHLVGKILDVVGIPHELFRRWCGAAQAFGDIGKEVVRPV